LQLHIVLKRFYNNKFVTIVIRLKKIGEDCLLVKKQKMANDIQTHLKKMSDILIKQMTSQSTNEG